MDDQPRTGDLYIWVPVTPAADAADAAALLDHARAELAYETTQIVGRAVADGRTYVVRLDPVSPTLVPYLRSHAPGPRGLVQTGLIALLHDADARPGEARWSQVSTKAGTP